MTKEDITLFDVWEALGEVKSYSRSLGAEVALVRQAVQEHGLIFGQLAERCELRGKTCMHQMSQDRARLTKQSDELARLRDNSQVLHVEQVKAKVAIATVAKVAAGVLTLAALGALVIKALHWIGGSR